ncbi:hypothetical protein [Candidatus Poriferisocius sp.]|uniref:hypothetical protein n=1 Tax=Candidatus Poriferisocius sp. TaxID=3101276 RepID=UPI003B51C6A8
MAAPNYGELRQLVQLLQQLRELRARKASFTEREDGMWRLFTLFDLVTAQAQTRSV